MMLSNIFGCVAAGLGELGSLMDEEMCAVPKNCREDDDAETTSDVLALCVRTFAFPLYVTDDFIFIQRCTNRRTLHKCRRTNCALFYERKRSTANVWHLQTTCQKIKTSCALWFYFSISIQLLKGTSDLS